MAKVLDKLKTAFAKDADGKLTDELEALRREERILRRRHNYVREDSHAGVDEATAAAAQRLRELVADARYSFVGSVSWDSGGETSLMNLAALWAASQPGFVATLHELIDQPETAEPPSDAEIEDALERRLGLGNKRVFGPLSRAELDAQLARLQSEQRARTIELQRRQAEQAKQDADRQFEERVAALDSEASQ
jgi:hypothetical protein